jgi:hypothetical protein
MGILSKKKLSLTIEQILKSLIHFEQLSQKPIGGMPYHIRKYIIDLIEELSNYQKKYLATEKDLIKKYELTVLNRNITGAKLPEYIKEITEVKSQKEEIKSFKEKIRASEFWGILDKNKDIKLSLSFSKDMEWLIDREK